jgi:glycosyltransferase involved in cell wall biosynthesis
MLFSIITATYNSKEHLDETVQSVLSQCLAEVEYIFIDGGSTDGTIDIIQSYADKDDRIRWISEPDDGIADAFNKGIRMATGEIIGILNSDDFYLNGTLTAVAAAYRSHPECDVFHGDMLRLKGDTVLFRLVPANVDTHIWREMPLNHPTVFVTRRAYEKVGGFDAKVRIAMDYDLMLRMYKAGCRFHYLERPLAAMRYGGASDERFLEGLREVRTIAIREGYPPASAWFWFGYKVTTSTIKNVLRRFGLYSLMRLHPKFRK